LPPKAGSTRSRKANRPQVSHDLSDRSVLGVSKRRVEARRRAARLARFADPHRRQGSPGRLCCARSRRWCTAPMDHREKGPGHAEMVVFIDGRRVAKVDTRAALHQRSWCGLRPGGCPLGPTDFKSSLLGTPSPSVRLDGFAVRLASRRTEHRSGRVRQKRRNRSLVRAPKGGSPPSSISLVGCCQRSTVIRPPSSGARPSATRLAAKLVERGHDLA
jgi:hypothetical protein